MVWAIVLLVGSAFDVAPRWNQASDFVMDHAGYLRWLPVRYLKLLHHLLCNVEDSVACDLEREEDVSWRA